MKLITYKKNKLNIKNILIAFLLLIILIIFIVFIINYLNPSNKLKRYLIKDKYECNNKICTKEINDITYSINYKNGNINANNLRYSFTILNNVPTLTINNNNLTCTYQKESYKKGELIDNTFTYTNECKTYIEEINTIIDYYNETMIKSKSHLNE